VAELGPVELAVDHILSGWAFSVDQLGLGLDLAREDGSSGKVLIKTAGLKTYAGASKDREQQHLHNNVVGHRTRVSRVVKHNKRASQCRCGQPHRPPPLTALSLDIAGYCGLKKGLLEKAGFFRTRVCSAGGCIRHAPLLYFLPSGVVAGAPPSLLTVSGARGSLNGNRELHTSHLAPVCYVEAPERVKAGTAWPVSAI
jgi:hypothetical protein